MTTDQPADQTGPAETGPAETGPAGQTAGRGEPSSRPGAGDPTQGQVRDPGRDPMPGGGSPARAGVHRRPPRRLRRAVLGGALAALLAGGVATAVTWPWDDPGPGGEAPAPDAAAGETTRPAADPPAGGDDGTRGEPPQVRQRGDFPNADNTGVPDGVSLTRSGPITVDQDGTVIENLLVVDGPIEIYANDVTIRNVRITNEQSEVQWGISQNEGYAGLVVEDSEIFGNADGPHKFASAISNHGGTITVRRVEIHTITDGIVTRHGLLEDNYLHSPRLFPEDHTDMIQANGGPAEGLSLEIRNNTVINTLDQTAAVFLQDFTGHETIPVQNVLLENNLFAGGGYTLYGGGMAADGHDPANIVIRDNVFSREVFPNCGHWGPSAYFDVDAPGSEWAGNVWEDDGSPVILEPQA